MYMQWLYITLQACTVESMQFVIKKTIEFVNFQFAANAGGHCQVILLFLKCSPNVILFYKFNFNEFLTNLITKVLLFNICGP